jgi:hypothetical protein
MRYMLLLAIALCLAGCSLKPELSLDDALEGYDWTLHTEADFWNTYPQYRVQYDCEMVRMEATS